MVALRFFKESEQIDAYFYDNCIVGGNVLGESLNEEKNHLLKGFEFC